MKAEKDFSLRQLLIYTVSHLYNIVFDIEHKMSLIDSCKRKLDAYTPVDDGVSSSSFVRTRTDGINSVSRALDQQRVLLSHRNRTLAY